jgi:oxygen-independent coproporphyrinogen-3 oxidase
MSLECALGAEPTGGWGFAAEPGRARPSPEAVYEAGLALHHLANTAYPIAHRQTIWSFRQPAEKHAALLARSLAEAEALSLYLHVPFCERRCAFCEYAVLERHEPALEAAYFQALEVQLDRVLGRLGLAGKSLRGLDVGGGTPSLVEPARIGRLLERALARLRPAPGFGVSIETTPKLAAQEPGRLGALRALGIERISMGLQSTSAGLLHAYGRAVQQADHNRLAVENIRAAGFRTLNIDLMYGFARQSLAELEDSLRAAVELAPEAITLYRMRYKGTRVEAEAAGLGYPAVVEMVDRIHAVLEEAGFRAPPGKNSYVRDPAASGASAYLTSRVIESVPYLGLGLGAQTFTNHLLAYNAGAASKRLEPYLASLARGELGIQDLYRLPRSEGMAKMVSVAFYFGAVDRAAFLRRFGLPLEAAYPEALAFVLSRELMQLEPERLRLTLAGERAFPGVIALFYSPAVQAYLLARAGKEGA